MKKPENDASDPQFSLRVELRYDEKEDSQQLVAAYALILRAVNRKRSQPPTNADSSLPSI